MGLLVGNSTHIGTPFGRHQLVVVRDRDASPVCTEPDGVKDVPLRDACLDVVTLQFRAIASRV